MSDRLIGKVFGHSLSEMMKTCRETATTVFETPCVRAVLTGPIEIEDGPSGRVSDPPSVSAPFEAREDHRLVYHDGSGGAQRCTVCGEMSWSSDPLPEWDGRTGNE